MYLGPLHALSAPQHVKVGPSLREALWEPAVLHEMSDKGTRWVIDCSTRGV